MLCKVLFEGVPIMNEVISTSFISSGHIRLQVLCIKLYSYA